MKSFIGAFRAITRCFDKCTSLISPFEDSIKGLQGAQRVQWSEDLTSSFKKIQELLKSPHILIVPRPTNHLIISMDASPANKGIGSTLFVGRNHQRLVAEFFSAKLKQHQINSLPCEHEALSISTSTTHFGPFIIESIHPTKILTDSKPCKEAHDRLRNGYFSASARISTLSTYNVTVEHAKGMCNKSSDYPSRNPQECLDKDCQICKFVYEQTTATVRSTVPDIVRCLENAIYQSSGMEICSTRMQNPAPCIRPLDTRNKPCQKGTQSERPSKISSNCHS